MLLTPPPSVGVSTKVSPVQIVLTIASICGVAFTVIVNVSGKPEHPFADGVTVIVPKIAFDVVFVEVNELIFELPDAPNPMPVLSFVQE